MGIPPQKIHIIEVGGPGTYTVIPDMIDTDTFTDIEITYLSDVHGGGTFESGQLLEGWTWSNCVGREGETVDPPVPVKPKQQVPNQLEPDPNWEYLHIFIQAISFLPPVGPPMNTNAEITLVLVPEPSSIGLLCIGCAAVLIAKRKK